jgi:2,5-diketo-D-gluconate reductase A
VTAGEWEPDPEVPGSEMHEFVMAERGVQHESWGGFAEGRNNLFSDPTLTQIGAAHGKSIAPVVLRWLTQRNIVAIPKSVRPERDAQEP